MFSRGHIRLKLINCGKVWQARATYRTPSTDIGILLYRRGVRGGVFLNLFHRENVWVFTFHTEKNFFFKLISFPDWWHRYILWEDVGEEIRMFSHLSSISRRKGYLNHGSQGNIVLIPRHDIGFFYCTWSRITGIQNIHISRRNDFANHEHENTPKYHPQPPYWRVDKLFYSALNMASYLAFLLYFFTYLFTLLFCRRTLLTVQMCLTWQLITCCAFMAPTGAHYRI